VANIHHFASPKEIKCRWIAVPREKEILLSPTPRRFPPGVPPIRWKTPNFGSSLFCIASETLLIPPNPFSLSLSLLLPLPPLSLFLPYAEVAVGEISLASVAPYSPLIYIGKKGKGYGGRYHQV